MSYPGPAHFEFIDRRKYIDVSAHKRSFLSSQKSQTRWPDTAGHRRTPSNLLFFSIEKIFPKTLIWHLWHVMTCDDRMKVNLQISWSCCWNTPRKWPPAVASRGCCRWTCGPRCPCRSGGCCRVTRCPFWMPWCRPCWPRLWCPCWRRCGGYVFFLEGHCVDNEHKQSSII